MEMSKNQQKREAKRVRKALEKAHPASLWLGQALDFAEGPANRTIFPLRRTSAVSLDGTFEVTFKHKRYKVTVVEVDSQVNS
jgi:hypothetical protein